MGRLFWIIIGVLGFALIALIVTHDTGSVGGVPNNTFASTVYLLCWAVVLIGAIFGSGMRFGDVARQIAIWGILILVLMAAYIFRYDMQDIGSRLTAGLIPGSPISRQGDDGRETVTLIRAPNGHFQAIATVNNIPVDFLVDTGASSIVLSARDAREAGIDPDRLNYSVLTQTANGTGRAADVRLDALSLGNITRRNIRALVAEPRALSQSLLGQSFLESLSSYEKRGDRLTLRD